jgi:hypothetical protein
MNNPSKEEFEESGFYKRGVEIRANREGRKALHHLLQAMSPWSWQYDAVIAGYNTEDARRKRKPKAA